MVGEGMRERGGGRGGEGRVKERDFGKMTGVKGIKVGEWGSEEME